MKTRIGILAGVLLLLGIWYVVSFTEWLHAEPIRILVQFRELPRDRAWRTRKGTSDAEKAPRPPRPASSRPAPDAAPGGVAPNSVAANTVVRIETNGTANPARLAAAQRLDPGFGAGTDFEGLVPVVFALDAEYRLTSIRVMEAEPTNHAALITWQANSTSNSIPTKALIYGRVPRGMKLKDPSEPAKKLEPGVLYKLELKAGHYSGEVTFRAKEEEPAEPAQ